MAASIVSLSYLLPYDAFPANAFYMFDNLSAIPFLQHYFWLYTIYDWRVLKGFSAGYGVERHLIFCDLYISPFGGEWASRTVRSED